MGIFHIFQFLRFVSFFGCLLALEFTLSGGNWWVVHGFISGSHEGISLMLSLVVF